MKKLIQNDEMEDSLHDGIRKDEEEGGGMGRVQEISPLMKELGIKPGNTCLRGINRAGPLVNITFRSRMASSVLYDQHNAWT